MNIFAAADSSEYTRRLLFVRQFLESVLFKQR
jgi:hypothetical protein